MIELFNAVFTLIFFSIGIFSAMSWMHKQTYIFKKAREFQKTLKTKGIEASIFECF